MKIKLITILLISVSAFGYGQKKPDTTKQKPVYDYYIRIPAPVYQSLIQVTQMYKEAVIYVPTLTGDQTKNIQLQINQLLDPKNLQIKVDSVLRKTK
jgi:hypothetical protein